MLQQALSALLNPVAWLAVIAAGGGGFLMGDSHGGAREQIACNAIELEQQVSNLKHQVLGLEGYIGVITAAAQADADRAAADLDASRLNQEFIDATPPNAAACLDRAAIDRVFGVR